MSRSKQLPKVPLKVETTEGLELCIGTCDEVALAAELLQALRGARAC